MEYKTSPSNSTTSLLVLSYSISIPPPPYVVLMSAAIPGSVPSLLQQPGTYHVTTWLTALINAHAGIPPEHYRVVRVRHLKAPKDGKEHEFLELTVQLGNQHAAPITHLIIERIPDPEDHRNNPVLPWRRGRARDNVIVPESNDDNRNAVELRVLTWQFDEAPPLRRFMQIAAKVSTRRPLYNIWQHQCYWYSRLLYTVIQAVYSGPLETIHSVSYRRSRYMLLFGGFDDRDVEVLQSFGNGIIAEAKSATQSDGRDGDATSCKASSLGLFSAM